MELLRIGGSKVKLVSGLLTKECVELFDLWKSNPTKIAY